MTLPYPTTFQLSSGGEYLGLFGKGWLENTEVKCLQKKHIWDVVP